LSAYSSAWRLIDDLIHPDAKRSSSERTRHEFFIFSRVATTLLAVIFVPPILALSGGIAIWQSGVFVWIVFPLAAVVHVSRTGRLAEAELISMFSLVLLTIIIALASGPSRDIALGWLMLIPLEAAISGSPVLLLAASLFVVATLLGLMGLHNLGLIVASPQISFVAVVTFAAPSGVYAALLTFGADRNRQLRRRLESLAATRYHVLSDAIGDLVLRHNASGEVLSASGSVRALFGLEAVDLVDRGLFYRIHVADRPAYLRTLESAAAQDKTVAATVRLRTGRSESSVEGFEEPIFAWVEVRAHRFADAIDSDDGAALVSVVRDVTAAKHAEERLEAARAEAELANSWKDRLLANVSHELRTPLNAILGFSEILASPELAPRDLAKQREYASIVHSSAEHLLSVVNLVLDMSRIEAGKFEILPEPFDVGQLIASCSDMLRLKAEASGVELTTAPPPVAARELVADRRACRQILLNLMSNAVSADVVDDHYHISVTDNGIGISEDHLPKLGDPFYQVRSSYDRTFEGAGLGLSLVRGLVGLQGGSLSIESVAGQGTRVTVRMPLDCSVERPAPGATYRLETAPYFREGVSLVRPEPRKPRNESASGSEKRIA
jgi:cell cycle sensor histidine kinase DivJ